MGRSAIMMVFGLAVVLGYVGISLRGSVNRLTENQYGYYQYANARNMARLAIHRHLRFIEGINPGSGSQPAPPSSASFAGGTYTITADPTADTLTLHSTGRYADSTYEMYVKLLLVPKPFPPSPGAIGVAASPASLSISGQASVDGRNHDSTGTNLTGSGDLPGITAMNSTDSAQFASSGGSYLIGNPPVAVNSSITNPAAFMNEYIQSADSLIRTGGTIGGNRTYGSSTRPAIVVVNPDNTPGFSVKFTGNMTGYGILAVSGDVQFAGGLTWYGLVIAFGSDNTVEIFSATGNPQIIGGVILAGTAGAQLALKGTGSSGGKVLYSSQALDKAKKIPQLMFYSVVEWYE
ncbi:MAG: hypothetical protein HY966_05060 [Ignavibacteriales bacterium]|nr:hypothetical protein [Ignavibacteriales bacterium]